MVQLHFTCKDGMLNLLYVLLLLFYFNEIEAYRYEKSNQRPSFDQPKYKRLVRTSNFLCQTRGKFVDTSNYNSYWDCDVSQNGRFVATHKLCPLGYVFSTDIRDCVIKSKKRCAGGSGGGGGDSCEDKNDGKVSYIVVVTEEATYPDTSEGSTTPSCVLTTSSCPNKHTTCQSKPDRFKCSTEGVFPDPTSCTSFYICHRKKGCKNQFEKIKVNCPDGMAFDSKAGWCSQNAKRSAESKEPLGEDST